jgi:hypothetical protein
MASANVSAATVRGDERRGRSMNQDLTKTTGTKQNPGAALTDTGRASAEALDKMETLCRSDIPKSYVDLVGMLWEAFELGQQRQGKNYSVRDLPEIPPLETVTRRCVELKEEPCTN